MKMKDSVYDIAWEIAEGLIGHCAMESVTGYVVRAINEKHGMSFDDTTEMLEWSLENGGECFECPECGWYDEYLDGIDGSESIDGEEHEGCSECIEGLRKED